MDKEKEIKKLQKITSDLDNICINTIVLDLGVTNFDAYQPYGDVEESSVEYKQAEAVFLYYERIRTLFIDEILKLKNKELTQEEYDNLIDEYNEEFMEEYGHCVLRYLTTPEKTYFDEEFEEDDLVEDDED